MALDDLLPDLAEQLVIDRVGVELAEPRLVRGSERAAPPVRGLEGHHGDLGGRVWRRRLDFVSVVGHDQLLRARGSTATMTGGHGGES